jgi:serine protease
MRTLVKMTAAAVLAGAMVSCPQPPPPANKIAVAQAQSSLVAGSVLPVTVSTGVRLQATTSTPLTLNWNVNGVSGGNSTLGTVNPAQTAASSNGIITYTAPASIPTPATVSIQACNAANASECGALTVQIIRLGDGGISGTVTLPPGLLSSAPVTTQALPQSAPARPFQPDWSMPHVPGQVLIVGTGSAVSAASLSTASSLRGLSIERVSQGVSSVRTPGGQRDQDFAARIAQETGAMVQPNYIYRPLGTTTPNDYDPSKQFDLKQTDVPSAWAIRTDVPDGMIAVLDTGADFSHPDLQGRLIAGADYCPNATNNCTDPVTSTPNDFSAGDGSGGHGTHTVGIIAAATNNGIGIAGITQSGKVLVVKVLGLNTSSPPSYAGGTSASISSGIRYAADQGAKIINMSLGVASSQATAFDPDAVVSKAIDYADSKDVLMVVSAGNYQPTAPNKPVFYPATNPKVIAVGAVDPNNAISGISAQGPELDLVAPGQGQSFAAGQGILSTALGGGYETRYGTSEAAPQVAAVAGLIRAKNSSLTALQTRSILETTAKDLGTSGRDNTFGFGLIQAGAALTAASTPVNRSKTTVYVYADKYIGDPSAASAGSDCSSTVTTNCYNGNDLGSGRSIVVLSGTSGSGTYAVTLSRAGTPLAPGIYRIVACEDKNGNGQTCDTGDLGGRGPVNISYLGSPITGQDVTLKQL